MLKESYNGLNLVISPFMKTDEWEQVRKHKRKRINKKWRKRYGLRQKDNMTKMLVIGNTAYVSQGLYRKIKREVEAMKKKEDLATTIVDNWKEVFR